MCIEGRLANKALDKLRLRGFVSLGPPAEVAGWPKESNAKVYFEWSLERGWHIAGVINR
jgi:hypothetical protein